MRSAVITGDCVEVMRGLEECSVDSIVTDPPYGLGFMGKKWDDLPPGVEFADAALRVLKPGGYVLAFGGSRTYHRLACAVEDAGFEIRDQIIWIYGSGFPKSHNLKGEREGWGTALKPAHEPIVVARKPLAGTVAENVLRFGTGALNIDGCRIEHDGTGQWGTINRGDSRSVYGSFGDEDGETPGSVRNPLGRWPANVVLDEEAGRLLDEQSGTTVSKESNRGIQHSGRHGGIADKGYNFKEGTDGVRGHNDTGGASRFFYCAKASRGERNAGLGGFDEGMPRGLGMGDNAVGAGRGSRSTPRANVHPTVKPISLMRYLVRLVTPPGGVILDPFLGSGTTGCAAALEGFEFVGIEREPEYVKIAEARIAHWSAQPVQMELGDAA